MESPRSISSSFRTLLIASVVVFVVFSGWWVNPTVMRRDMIFVVDSGCLYVPIGHHSRHCSVVLDGWHPIFCCRFASSSQGMVASKTTSTYKTSSEAIEKLTSPARALQQSQPPSAPILPDKSDSATSTPPATPSSKVEKKVSFNTHQQIFHCPSPPLCHPILFPLFYKHPLLWHVLPPLQLQEVDDEDYEDYDYDYEEEETSAAPQVTPRSTPTPAPVLAANAGPTGSQSGSWRFPADMPYLEALNTCETLKCVSDAHKQPKGAAKYNFPHFMIAGWSKSATTSLYQHLNDHPDILSPKEKEPMLFTDYCDMEGNKLFCTFNKQYWYVREVLKVEQFVKAGGQIVPYEATPRIMDVSSTLSGALQSLLRL